MLDSVDLINFVIESLINEDGRMDLILSYYPNEYVFYYFTSRMYNLLTRYPNLRDSVIAKMKNKLEFTLKYLVTDNILNAAKKNTNGESEE